VTVKILFVPFSIAFGLLAGAAAKRLFETAWGLVDEKEPPDAKRRDVPIAKLAAALAVEGALFRLSRGLLDHGARRGFARLTGTWPGEDARAQ
jgi:Protein of unknown function (DUF4235)